LKKKLRRFLAVVCVCAMLLTAASALTVEQAIELLEQHYVNELPEAVYEAQSLDEVFAIVGDPYTYYMEPQQYDDFIASVEDTSQVVGIGVQIGFTSQGMEILEVVNGGPAEEAGLEVGDYIIAVDGVSCTPATESMADLVRGEEGAPVMITIRQKDGSVGNAFLTRRKVIINNTNISVLDGRVGLITCSSFGSETAELIKAGILKHDEEVDVWLLDLRSNSGGIADVAVETVGVFAGAGIHLYFRDAQDEYYVSYASEPYLTPDPVIVLTNLGSASGSELVPADIRDCSAGISVGQRTFGKGVAQITLTDENTEGYFTDDSMKVTAYRFFSTRGNTTDLIGVIPTLLVEDAYTQKVAELLSATQPENTLGWLQIQLGGWSWYIDTEKAQSELYSDSFDELLEALPPDVPVFVGLGEDAWFPTLPEIVLATYGNEAHSRALADVAQSGYANELNVLATYRILRGMEEGAFHPEQALTRAQLCAMVDQTLNVTTKAPSRYSDVDNSAWYADDVMVMCLSGLMDGYGDGTFRPDELVTNEQLIAVMGRLASFLNLSLYDVVSGFGEEELSDERVASFPDWAREEARLMLYVQEFREDGSAAILYDALENIDLDAPVLREQAGATLYNLLTNIGVISY